MEKRPGTGSVDTSGFWRDVIVMACVLVLPGAVPVAGGLVFLVPLFLLTVYGRRGTTGCLRVVGAALVAAGILALATGTVGSFLLTCTFAVAGLVMGWTAEAGLPPPRVGAWGFGTLALGWLLFWGGYGVIADRNPYTELVAAIDRNLEEAIPLYMEQAGIPPDMQPEVEAAFQQTRALVPILLPGGILSSLAGCIWMVLIVFQWLAKRTSAIRIAWPSYRQWRLPEGLVWVFILLGFGVLTEPTKPLAIGGLLFLGVLYFFQGLAVLGCLLERWRLPGPLRVTAYVIILLQVYGMLLVAILGLADVWADFGRLARNETI